MNFLFYLDNDSDAMKNYYERRKSGQTGWISTLRESIEDVSNTEAFRSNGDGTPITLTTVPFSDIELVGVPALAYLARSSFSENPSFSYLMDTSCKFDSFLFTRVKTILSEQLLIRFVIKLFIKY